MTVVWAAQDDNAVVFESRNEAEGRWIDWHPDGSAEDMNIIP
jgi:hypothetical protein